MSSNSSNPADAHGAPFGERYQIVKKLGSGGMGTVFHAFDKTLKKDVAIKVLLKGLQPEKVVRFQQEAKAAAKLNHPNVVRVLNFGETPAGDLFLVMEYARGTSLETIISQQDHIDVVPALSLFIQIAEGLEHAHSHGVLHRDVKPSNVVVDEEENNHAQIVDFGLAKVQTVEQKLTSTGVRVGSPLYMSPEQCRGTRVDVRSDIYSMGCLMYKTLTGAPPLQGPTYIDTIRMQQEVVPARLAETRPDLNFPEELENIVAQALHKEEDERFQTFHELKSALLSLEETLRSDRESEKGTTDGVTISRGISVLGYVRKALSVWYVSVPVLIASVSIGLMAYNRTAKPIESVSKPVPSLIEYVAEVTNDKNMKKYYSRRKAYIYNRAEREKRFNDQYASNAYFQKECAKDPQLKKALKDGSLTALYADEDRSRLVNDVRYDEQVDLLYKLWVDPKIQDVWADTLVVEFVKNPENWKKWDDSPSPAFLSKYKANKNVQKLMRQKNFMRLTEMPAFEELVADSRFQNVIKNPMQMKLSFAMKRSEEGWLPHMYQRHIKGNKDNEYILDSIFGKKASELRGALESGRQQQSPSDSAPSDSATWNSTNPSSASSRSREDRQAR